MKSILNVDFLYLFGYLSVATLVEKANPYLIFFGGIIAILVGTANLIKFFYWLKDRKTKQ